MIFPIYDPILNELRSRDYAGGGSSRFVINVTDLDYGITGDGSFEGLKLQAAFDAAALLKDDGRPLVVIPPGLTINIGAANLVLEEGVDFEMRGSKLTSSVVSGAAVTIGRDGALNEDARLTGLHISRDFTSDPHLFADTIGFRIINVFRPWIEHDWVSGFKRGIQLRACYAGEVYGFCAYGNVFIGRTHCKYGLSLWCEDAYAATYGSWISAMRFHGGDFEGPGTATCGSVAAVVYEIGQAPVDMTLDGLVLQNNVFYSPQFQLGGTGEPGFASGGTVAPSMVGAHYWVGDHSYRCTQAGTFGTTALNLISTIRGATLTSGTTQWVCEGTYVRVPFLFKECGYSSTCYSAYWETGVGPFFHFVGVTAGGGHKAYDVHIGGPQYNQKRLINDAMGDRDSWDWSVTGDYKTSFHKLDNEVHVRSQSGQNVNLQGSTPIVLTTDGWHKRAIKGQAVWNIPGLAARIVDTLYSVIDSGYKIGRGCLLTGGGGYNQFGPLIPTDQFTRFKAEVIHKEVDVDFSGLLFVGYDAHLTPISLSSDTTHCPAIMCDRGSIASLGGSSNAMLSARDNWLCNVVVTDPAIKYLHISTYWGLASTSIDGIRITAYQDDYRLRTRPLTFYEPYTLSTSPRHSDGEPTQGYFLTRGEYIANSNTSGAFDSTTGYIVVTAGILAPAWTASTAVYNHELRAKGGLVYAANTGFTTGSTGPSGTGTAIADGAGTWDYVAPEAVLTAVLQYRPIDPRSSLDYRPYHVGTFDLTTDTNADGFCNGVSSDIYGPSQTGLTYTHTSTSSRQGFTRVSGAGSNDGAGERIVFDATLASNKDYFLILKGHTTCTAATLPGFWIGLHKSTTDDHVLLTDNAYAPDGYVTSPIGQANGSGDVVLALRFTSPAYSLSGFGISVMSVQWAYPAHPWTATSYVDELWLIDIAAAETALGISLAGLGSAELYAIINAALTAVPPLSYPIKDSVTGAGRKITIVSGVLTVV